MADNSNDDALLKKINQSWNWVGFTAIKIEAVNEFGNIILKTTKAEFWRICPEELSCEKIASNEPSYRKVFNSKDFQEDWKMDWLLQIAKSTIGPLEFNKKYCLKIPGILGGPYEKGNIGQISFDELISFSGDLAYQIKDWKDGQKFKIRIENTPE